MIKAKINNKLLDVVSFEEYKNNQEIYNSGNASIEFPELDLILPINGKKDKTTGIYVGDGLFSHINFPSKKEKEKYSISSLKERNEYLDFSKVEDISNLISTQDRLKDIEYDILTNVDNVFSPPKITKNTTPEMAALKEAVISKNIDINKYASRFGANFNNDKRQYNKDSISMEMLKRHCKCLDIKATLILQDKNPSVPNPMGKVITVDLVDGGEDYE